MRDTKIFIAVSKAFQFFRLLQKDLFSVTGIVNDFENKDVKINYQIYGKRDTIFTKSAKEIAEDNNLISKFSREDVRDITKHASRCKAP
ncbi:hypothetical protein DA717_13975, partial [Piscirickettsiaceae bacterium NZ-RLO2]